MIPSLLFLALALVYGAALVAILRRPRGLPETLIALLLMGLCFDNLALAIGIPAGDSAWYRAVTVMRYAVHATVLPLLVVAGVSVARRAGLVWANYHRMIPAAALVASAGVVFGLATDVIGIELVQEKLYGHSRFVSADSQPPFATITTNVILLGIGLSLWWQARWPWLFAGALAIFLINGATAGQDWSIVAGNLAELVFTVAWLATLFHFSLTTSTAGAEPGFASPRTQEDA